MLVMIPQGMNVTTTTIMFLLLIMIISIIIILYHYYSHLLLFSSLPFCSLFDLAPSLLLYYLLFSSFLFSSLSLFLRTLRAPGERPWGVQGSAFLRAGRRPPTSSAHRSTGPHRPLNHALAPSPAA